jgi:sugar phosphate permease
LGDHPSSTDVRLRRAIAIELVLLGVMTTYFLLRVPQSLALYLSLALLFFVYVAVDTRRTAHRIWPPITLGDTDRWRGATLWMMLFSVPAAAAILLWGWWQDQTFAIERFTAAFIIYLPWAWLQQVLFQYYLLGRVRVLYRQDLTASILCGLIYGAVHFPHLEIMVLTSVVGSVWSYCYLKFRRLIPIAVSHALLGSSYYYGIRGRDLAAEVWQYLGERF